MSSWNASSLLSTLTATISGAEPDPEPEQGGAADAAALTPGQLVQQLTGEEGEVFPDHQEALLDVARLGGAALHADVASALVGRLQSPSIPVKVKAINIMLALLKEKEGGFAAAARPYVEAALTEHTRFGDSDPRDEAAALIRKAAQSCIESLNGASPPQERPQPRSVADDAHAVVDRLPAARGSIVGEEQAEAAEGVPPPAAAKADTPGSAAVVDHVVDDEASSRRDERVKQLGIDVQAVVGEGGRLDALEKAQLQRQADLAAAIEKFDALEEDVESLEMSQAQQTSSLQPLKTAAAGMQALHEQLRRLDDQQQHMQAVAVAAAEQQQEAADSAKDKDAAAAAAAAGAAEAANAKQEERLDALEGKIVNMAELLAATQDQAEVERLRATAAEAALSDLLQEKSDLLGASRDLLQRHDERLQERDEFENESREAILEEIRSVRNECMSQVTTVAARVEAAVALAKGAASVSSDTELGLGAMKEQVNMLFEQMAAPPPPQEQQEQQQQQQEQEQQEQQQEQEQQEEEAAAAGSGGADGTAAVAAVVVEFQGKLDAAQQSWAAKLTTVVKTLQSHKEMVAAATTQATAAIDGLGRVDEAFTSVERVAVIVEALSTRVDLLDLCCSDLTRVDLLDQQVVMGAAAESFDAAPAMNLADSSPAREVSSSHHDGDGESGK